jgi:hypothetical protein
VLRCGREGNWTKKGGRSGGRWIFWRLRVEREKGEGGGCGHGHVEKEEEGRGGGGWHGGRQCRVAGHGPRPSGVGACVVARTGKGAGTGDVVWVADARA